MKLVLKSALEFFVRVMFYSVLKLLNRVFCEIYNNALILRKYIMRFKLVTLINVSLPEERDHVFTNNSTAKAV